jgi:hypothetical protein
MGTISLAAGYQRFAFKTRLPPRPDRPLSAGHRADRASASGWEAKRAASRLN